MVSCFHLYHTHPNAGENIKMETEKIAGCESKANTLRSRNTRSEEDRSHSCLGHWVCMLVSAARIRLFPWEKKEKVASSLFRTPDWSHSWGWDEAVSKMKGDWIWKMCWSPCEMELSGSCRLRKTRAHPCNQEMNQAVCWLPGCLKITTETHFVRNLKLLLLWILMKTLKCQLKAL